MYNEEDRKWLYDRMKSSGIDTGNYDDFKNSLQSDEDREWYYNKSKELGLDVGSPEDFDNMMLEKKPTPAKPQEQKGTTPASPTAPTQQEAGTSTGTTTGTGTRNVRDKEAGSDVLRGMVSDYSTAIDKGKDFVGGIVDGVKGVFSPTISGLAEAAEKPLDAEGAEQRKGPSTEGQPSTEQDLMDGSLYGNAYQTYEDAFSQNRRGVDQAAILSRMGLEDNDENRNVIRQARMDFFDKHATESARRLMGALPDGRPDYDTAKSALSGVFYDRGFQDEVDDLLGRTGAKEGEKEKYINDYVKYNLSRLLQQERGYRKEDADHIVNGLFYKQEHISNEVNQREADTLTDTYLKGFISDEFAQFDEQARKKREELMQAAGTQQGTGGMYQFAMDLASRRAANEVNDPDVVLKSLEEKAHDIFASMMNNPQFVADVTQKAANAGMMPEEYVEKYIAPSFIDQLRRSFESTAVAREMPKSELEYVLNGFGDSIIGKLASGYLNSPSRQKFINQAEALVESGKADLKPSWIADAGRLGVSFVVDAPFFGLSGRVSSMAVSKVAMREVAGLVEKGMSEATARRIIAAKLASSSVGERVKQQVGKSILGGSVNMSAYEMMSEAARQVRDEEYSLGDLLRAGGHGAYMGAVLGAAGGVHGAATGNLAGGRRVLANLTGLLVETGAFTSAGVAEKFLIGHADEIHLGRDLVSNAIQVMVMKTATPHLAKNLRDMFSGKRTIDGVEFSRSEVQQIKDMAETQEFETALADLGNRLTGKGKGNTTAHKDGSGAREEFERRRDAWMEAIWTNKELDHSTKEKLALVYGGEVRKQEGADKTESSSTKEDISEKSIYDGEDVQPVGKGVFGNYERGRQAVMNGDMEGIRRTKYNTELAEERMNRLFPEEDERMQTVREAVEKAVSQKDDTSLGEILNENMAYLSAQQRDAILQYRDAVYGESGIEDAMNEQADAITSAIREEMEPHATEDGGIVELTLDNGETAYLKSGDPERNGGTVMVTLRDGEGNIETRQVAVDKITGIGGGMSVDDYVNTAAGERIAELRAQVSGLVDGLTPEEQVARREQIEKDLSAEDAAYKDVDYSLLANDGDGLIHEVTLVDGRKAYVKDGNPENEYGALTLVDETGKVITATDANGKEVFRFRHDVIARDPETGKPAIKEPVTIDEAAIRQEEQTETGENYAQKKVTAPLSEEVNEFDKPFILSSDGTTTFGEIAEDSGLAAAPIKLSLGENVVDKDGSNHGYGLLHIEASHGDQIRRAGFASVEEFVEAVAKNYDTIREGNTIAKNQTYLLEVSDEHNNTLFIQLSRDGSYWNVNSAGIFRKKYSRRMREVASLPTIGNSSSTETVEVNRGQTKGATATSENSSLTSEGKGNTFSPDLQGKEEKSVNSVVKSQGAGAAPEVTRASLVEKYGEERADRMIKTMAENTARAYEQLSQKDVSGIVDIEELAKHEDALEEAKAKAEYWKRIAEGIFKTSYGANRDVVYNRHTTDNQPAETDEVSLSGEQSGTTPSTRMNTPTQTVEINSASKGNTFSPDLQGKDEKSVNSVDKSQGAGAAKEAVTDKIVEKAIGNTYYYKDKNDGHRVEMKVVGINDKGHVEVMRTDYDANGRAMRPMRNVFLQSRMGSMLIDGSMKRVATTDEKLRKAYKGRMAMENLLSTLDDGEKERLWQAYDKAKRGGNEAATLAYRELVDELNEKHVEDIVANMRDKRQHDAENALKRGKYEEKVRKLRSIYTGTAGETYFEPSNLEPATLEEYAADFLGGVPKSGEGFIDHESLQEWTGHGRRRVGGDASGYGAYLAPRGKGKTIQRLAHDMWESLPDHITEQGTWSDVDCREALIDVLTSASRPSDIGNYILSERQRQAEEVARGEEEEAIASYYAGVASYHKVIRDDVFANRLANAIMDTNTEPSEAQKQAGNYRKGHVQFGGYDFTVENPKGSVRRGTDSNGTQWEQEMHNTYGYILGKKGKDGDHLDFFINDDADLDRWNGTVYVVDQVNADGKTTSREFDEHKVMYGFDSEEEARKAYLSNYEDGWQGLGSITGVSKEVFDNWLASSTRKMKPFADHSIVKNALENPTRTLPEGYDTAARDVLVKTMQDAGVKVSTDWEEGQRILDGDAERRARLMGSRVERRKADIAEKLQGRDLTDEQQTVVDVFTGKGDNMPLIVADKDGKERRVIMRQGNEIGAGTKHSIFRHYRTDANSYTADELLLIPDIIRKGERNEEGNKVSYSHEQEGVKYTVTTEIKGKSEQFTNFYTNKKAPHLVSSKPNEGNTPAGVRNRNTNTFSGAQVRNEEASSGAKLQKVSEKDKQETEKIFDAAKKKFGTTYDIREAGYILPDGTMLDFSGKHELEAGTDASFLKGQRSTDHREISKIAYDLDAEGNEIDTGIETSMQDFIERGAIRIDSNAGTINLSQVPTGAQKEVLRRLISRNDGYVSVDFGNGWDSEHYAEYDGAKALRVLSDIDKYYNEGIRPQGDSIADAKYQKVAPVFYSNAEHAVEGIKQEKATPEQWLKMIEKAGGMKAGEDKWLGLSEWLKGQDKKSLTKQEVLDYIRENQVQVEEVNYTERREFNDNGEVVSDAPIDSTRLRYTTEGLDNKREIALTVPTIEPYNESDNIHFGDAGEGRAVAWVRFGETTTKRPLTEEEIVEMPKADQWEKVDGSNFVSKRDVYFAPGTRNQQGHDYIVDKNGKFVVELGNTRSLLVIPFAKEGYDSLEEAVNEYNKWKASKTKKTERVLVIDEIQSKRHQDGREKGYRTAEAVAEEERLVDAVDKAQEAYDAYTRKMGDKYDGAYEDIYAEMTDAERAEADRLEQEVYVADEQLQNHDVSGIPDAPFEKNWHELAMKRMLRYAAENGYDKIAWTTGEQQAERYNIGDVVEKIISYDYPATKDAEGRESKKIEIRLKEGDTMTMRVNQEGRVIEGRGDTEGKQLADVVGKDLAKRIMAGEGKDGTIFDADRDLPAKVIEDDALRIGGEGMKGFYDQMLPRFMDKYGKKWGVKVGEVELPNLEESAQHMWGINVTPEMKESVMEGQPMFFKTRDGEAYGFTLNGEIHIDPRIATSETPIHEYTHLWGEMKRKSAPEEWQQIKDVLLKDEMVKPFIDKVREEYPELTGEGREDAFLDEVLAQYSGKHGKERLREIAEEIAKNNGGDMTAKTMAEIAVRKLKNVLDTFWRGVSRMMGWKYTTAEEVADKVLHDLLSGVNPTEVMKEAGENVKGKGRQSEIGEKTVRNVVVDSSKEKLPTNKQEALATIPEGGKVVWNKDQNTNVRVGRKALRHSSLHDETYVYKAYGKIDDVVGNAVKIGNEPVSPDEIGHTHSVGIFYAPINIDGVQYSARMVMKEYENKNIVLDELSLYNIAMHKEKTPSHTNLNASERGGAQYDGAVSGYKVKDLIHSTQENDQKLLEISDKSNLNFQREQGEAATEVLRTEKGGKENKENSFSLGGNSVSLHSERDVEAVRGQRERFSPTAPWRDGVEDVVVHTTLGTLKGKHVELYNKAKAGDVEAAEELVSKVVKPERVKALAEAHPDATVVPVQAEEALGRNAIPAVYAKRLEEAGLSRTKNIVQINKPFHTGSDRVGRFIRRARFDGEVEAGKEYILVDDHITMGSTLRDLKDYIEGKGGKVVAVSTLTASAGATKLRPTEQQKQQLKERGVTNEQLRELGIADSADGLTRREAQEILVLANTRGNRRSSRTLSSNLDNESNDIANDTVGEATIVAMSYPNSDGYNESDPLGKKLSDLKKEAGSNSLVGYTDSKSGDYVFLGNDTSVVKKFLRPIYYQEGTQNGMPMVRVAKDHFDKLSPVAVRNGLKIAITNDTPDAVGAMMSEIRRRQVGQQERPVEKPQETGRMGKAKAKMVSMTEGNLFGDEDFEGNLFSQNKQGDAVGKPQDARGIETTLKAEQENLVGKPQEAGRTGTPEQQARQMTDEGLLEEIAKGVSQDSWNYHIEEYDRRHNKEYLEGVDNYTEMLEREATDLDDAYGMYAEAAKRWKEGGYGNEERTALRSQMDALEDYIQKKEAERMEEEDDLILTEDATAQPSPTEKQAEYEKQKEEVRAVGYDLTQLKMRELEEGEECHVERRYVNNGFFSFTGGEHIDSAADVAYLFRQLEDSSVENSFMVLIKDGTPTVIHLGIGNYASTVAPLEQALVAFKELNPDKVVFLHNHPSGNLRPSRQDLQIAEKVQKLFGKAAAPSIIIDTKSGKYAEFVDGGSWTNDRPKQVDKEVPVKVFNFSRQVFDKEWNPETAFKVLSSDSVAAYVSSHRLGEHKKMSLLVLDQAGHVTGNIFLPWTTLKEAVKRDNLRLISTYTNQMGGTSVVLYGSYERGSLSESSAMLRSIKNNLRTDYNIHLMDAMSTDGMSAYEQGWIAEDKGTYSRQEAKEAATETLRTEKDAGDKEYQRLKDIVEKPKRIEKLKNSKPVEITGREYEGKYELNRDSAKKYIKDSLRGTYTIKDTGEKILLAKDGAQKVTSHSMGSEAHLKSIAAVPQMIENAIYISELPNEKGNGKYDSYRYYVTGMRIGGEDYTAKIVIGVDENGNKYYDHSLTEIEKGKLIDEVGALSTTLPSDNESPYLSVGKDTKLLSILQINPEEIAQAEARMREIEGVAERPNAENSDIIRFAKVSKHPAMSNMQRQEQMRKDVEERRWAKAKAAAEDAGIHEPRRESYMEQAHRRYEADHKSWEQDPDGKEEPIAWDYEKVADDEYRAALKEYEKKLEPFVPEETLEYTTDDAIVERERQVKSPATKMVQDVAKQIASDQDPTEAHDTVKMAVINRRKDMEEVMAADSIYIHDIRKQTDEIADEMMRRMGVDDTRIKGMKVLEAVSDGKVKSYITGKDIREALPYLIEADMRKREIVQEVNKELEKKGSLARISVKDLDNASKEIDMMREDAEKLLGIYEELRQEEKTEADLSEDGKRLRDRVREQAAFVAAAMTNMNADDVMAALRAISKRVLPEHIKVKEVTPELKGIIGSVKDWYAQCYGWLEEAGLRKDNVGYYRDYVNHIWDKEKSEPEAYDRYVANLQPTTSKNMRQRNVNLRTLMDGMDLGLKPKVEDISELMGEYSKTNTLSWGNKKMLRDLSYIDVIERDEKGYPKSILPLLSSVVPFDKDKYDSFDIPGILAPVWVHKAASDKFKLVFESYEPGEMMGAYDKLASLAKNIELSWSGFHAAALSEVYVAQNVTRPKKAAQTFYKYMIHDSLLQGQPPAYADPELYRDAAKHLVKLGATADYAPEVMKDMSQRCVDMLEGVRTQLKSTGLAGKVAGQMVGVGEVVATAVKLMNNGMDKFLWTWLHDGLKLCQYKMFRDEAIERLDRKYEKAAGKNPKVEAEKTDFRQSKEYQEELERALDEAGQYINDQFGGQHFEVIGVSPKSLRMMRRFLLSPDWLLSTQRHFLANFGFGSIYGKANIRSFMDFYKKVIGSAGKKMGIDNSWAEKDVPEGRYARAKASIACYGLGCAVFYPLIMNAVNAYLRKKDEEYELQKEQENPEYVSKYRLAYPDGMKGFEVDNLSLNPFNSFNLFGDYGMGGNAEGKKSHLFAGRYKDGKEMYIRWGKQFREFPELFENEQGDVAFPSPLLKRLMGKSNPNIRWMYDTLNYYTRWDKSKNDKDLEDRWKRWIGDGKLKRNILIPVGIGSEKMLMNYIPFWAPTQKDKEWKMSDMILPSTKGFTAYKARNYFEEFIKAGDEDGIKETFKAAVLNGMSDSQITKAYESAQKALESEAMDNKEKDAGDLQGVTEQFNQSSDLQERKKLQTRIKKMMAVEEQPPRDWHEFMESIREREQGSSKEASTTNDRYLMKATSEDILEDARVAQIEKKIKDVRRELREMEDDGASAEERRRWREMPENRRWLDLDQKRKRAYNGGNGINALKKKLGKDDDDRIMESVREKRRWFLNEVGQQ